MSPGVVMSSEIPWMAWRRTSSAAANDSEIVICWSQTERRRSLGITIRVSTLVDSSSLAFTALIRRFAPSNEKGRVTTATVRAPSSWATLARTGAAPLPVPPPMPAVRKIMSIPRTISRKSSSDSSADCRPNSGFPPTPNPLLTLSPIRTRVSAWQRASAWASVFIPTNSTPEIRASTMRSTALQPAPPTPTTLIGGSPSKSSRFAIRSSFLCIPVGTATAGLAPLAIPSRLLAILSLVAS